MKPVHLLPPALALAIAAIWLGSQHRSISALKDQTGELRKRVETARHDASREGADPRSGKSGKNAAKKLDWKALAQKQRAMQGGNDIQGMRDMMAMQRTLLEMSPDDLLAQLDEIDALDLSKDLKSGLQGIIIGVLAQKDPKLAVERFADQLDNARGGMSWQISAAFQQWAVKDPAAAMAWMDARVADGKFASTALDGKNEQRLQFERGLVISLLSSDPQAAEKRMSDLPADQRADLLRNGMLFGMKPGSEKALADLIRHQIPEDLRLSTFGQCVGQLVHQGGFERVDKFLAEVGPSQEEKDAVVSNALQTRLNSNRDKAKLATAVEEGRAWALRQSPDSADRITGEALGGMHDFGSAAELAVKYHEEGGNDDVLVAFLSSDSATANATAARALLDKITDEQKREELREKLSKYR
jgi:hypothetical protein